MKTALVFGSTGLIGGHILSLLINNNNYNKIKIFVRSSPSNLNEKVDVISTDFLNLNSISSTINGDDCFFSIGTTKKKSPDKIEYRRIEYNLPVEMGRIGKENSG